MPYYVPYSPIPYFPTTPNYPWHGTYYGTQNSLGTADYKVTPGSNNLALTSSGETKVALSSGLPADKIALALDHKHEH